MTSILTGEDAAGAAVGDRVVAEFPRGPDGEAGMPVFRRVPA